MGKNAETAEMGIFVCMWYITVLLPDVLMLQKYRTYV